MRLEQRQSNYNFILDLTPGFNELDKDNCKTRLETFNCWDLVWLILEVWRYWPVFEFMIHHPYTLIADE